MIDYLRLAQEYHGGRHDGFLTDVPIPMTFRGLPKLSEDDFVKVRYDAQTMRWIANRPSRIKYQTAKELIKQYRQEYAEKWD